MSDMLTGFQLERVAYVGDGYVLCRACAIKRAQAEVGEPAVEAVLEEPWDRDDTFFERVIGLDPLSRYGAEESFGDDGLYCDDCTAEIVEPWEGEGDEDA